MAETINPEDHNRAELDQLATEAGLTAAATPSTGSGLAKPPPL
jgi:hypothetical protein